MDRFTNEDKRFSKDVETLERIIKQETGQAVPVLITGTRTGKYDISICQDAQASKSGLRGKEQIILVYASMLNEPQRLIEEVIKQAIVCLNQKAQANRTVSAKTAKALTDAGYKVRASTDGQGRKRVRPAEAGEEAKEKAEQLANKHTFVMTWKPEPIQLPDNNGKKPAKKSRNAGGNGNGNGTKPVVKATPKQAYEQALATIEALLANGDISSKQLTADINKAISSNAIKAA